jgi:hypothetical protein
MSAEVNQDVVQEVVQPTEAENQGEAQQPQRGSKEYNFAELRAETERKQRRIDELEYQIRRSQEPVQSQPNRDPLAGLSKEDYATIEAVEALAERKVEERLQAQEAAFREDRARIKFKDYDDVVTEDNLKQLIGEDVELYESLQNSSDPYVAAYKMVKKSAFYHDKGKKRNVDAEKLEKNVQKPVNANAVQTRPLAAATSFQSMSEQERHALWKETQDYASRR